jgi:hypothetical protein
MLQLYPDFRVGGKPKFILASEPPKLMFIPDEVRKCVVYIGYRLSSGEMSLQGTAFEVSRPVEGVEGRSYHYLITTAHVIKGISSKENFDGKILLRVNLNTGDAQTVETDASDWLFHPEESEVDVAVLPFVSELNLNADIKSIPVYMFLDEQLQSKLEISIGDEVFLTGMFHNHHGRKRNIPIVRVGNIAAKPEEKVRTQMGFIDAYLIEVRSIGGLSGSPVFVHLGVDRAIKKELVQVGNRGSTFFLLGLMHGHYNVNLLNEDAVDMDTKTKEVVNMGIAIVVPSEKILEVINQPMIREKETESENKMRESKLPTLDSLDEDEGITQKGFEDALKLASRRTSELDQETKETSE